MFYQAIPVGTKLRPWRTEPLDCRAIVAAKDRVRVWNLIAKQAPCRAAADIIKFVAVLILCGYSVCVQAQESASVGVKEDTGSNTLAIGVLTPVQVPQNQERGSITGIVIDPTGAAVAGARVALIRDDHSADQQAVLGQTATGEDGHFVLSSSMPGPFQLSITASGFAPQTLSGVLPPGGVVSVPQITLEIATVNTEVQVGLSRTEIAQEQIQVQEKQRVLGVFPNYYVTYVPNAEPLVAKQKFELTWKFVLDPVSFGLNGVIAGIQQATNEFPGYGQGAEGYAKRFGAAYATFFTSTVISNAILPSLLKQDPRYFYKGTGTNESRVLYAMANAVICKGDNRRWQANYSNILGNLAAGGISNLYYPAADRNGVGLTFESAAIGIAGTAAGNIFEEFLLRRLTPHAGSEPAKP